MSTVTLQEFETQARAKGFDEIVERHWPPQSVLETHTHPFDVLLRVVSGEMWLRFGSDTHHLGVGDSIEFDRHVPHAERYGDEGATYWVARRNSPR